MRKHTIERLVQKLADLYYLNHNSTLKAMVNLLRRYGFKVIREYEIDMGTYNGRIDIYGDNGTTIGLELESGLTPKYRSMEKLTRLNPDIAILVVARGTLSDQYEKLDDMLQSGGRYLYLVSLEESYYWTRNDLTM